MSHVPACVRTKLTKCPARIDPRFYEPNLEHNQQAKTCCRNMENMDIEAFYSTETERWRGGREQPPDIYILHCNDCGRKHRVFCVGSGPRPYWEIR